MKRPCKALLFMCTRCRQKGSITKRLMQHDNELARAHSEQLASARPLEQAEAREQSTAIELTALKEECAVLREEVKDLLKGSVKLEVSSPPTVVKAEDKPSDSESSSDENSDEGSTISQASGRQSHKANQHPPGFKKSVAGWISSQESRRKRISSCGSRTLRRPHQHMAGVMIRRLDGSRGSLADQPKQLGKGH